MPENDEVVYPCLNYLHALGVVCWRQNTGAMTLKHKDKKRHVRFSPKGMADIAGVLPGGIALYVECKMPGNEPTPDQEKFLADVGRNDAVALVVHSLDELIEQLEDVL